MAETGKLLDPIIIITEYAEQGAFRLIHDEGPETYLEHDAERDVIVASGDIGTPPPHAAAEVYVLFLRMSALGRETGGLRFGLDADGGADMLLWDLPLGVLSPQSLAAVLSGFVERMRMWRQIVAAGSQFEININYKDRAPLSAAFQNIDTMSREGLLALREQLTKSTGEIDGLMRVPFGAFNASNDGDFDTEMILRNALEIGAVDEQELQDLGYDTDLKPFKADLLQAAGIIHA